MPAAHRARRARSALSLIALASALVLLPQRAHGWQDFFARCHGSPRRAPNQVFLYELNDRNELQADFVHQSLASGDEVRKRHRAGLCTIAHLWRACRRGGHLRSRRGRGPLMAIERTHAGRRADYPEQAARLSATARLAPRFRSSLSCWARHAVE
jgi:hypothetical protein